MQTWPGLLGQLVGRQDLAQEDTAWAMNEIMSGSASPAQIGAFAVALRSKGETADEIAGLAEAMLGHALRVSVDGAAADVVGTGGDQSGTVNISTMSALVVAATGVPVVKHGNRAASSKCGSADVLEALGVTIRLTPEGVRACVAELGIGFCFAQAFHPALRHAGPVRAEIGIPTAFNVLGPLTNPAQPTAGLVGCGNPRLAPIMAAVLAGRGFSMLVARGDDGLDEITTTTTTTVWAVSGGSVRPDKIDPTRLGFPVSQPEDLRGGDASANAAKAREVLGGAPGPIRNTVLLNSAAAIAAFRGLSDDLHADLAAALPSAAEAIDSGAAAALLERWVARTAELATP
jgi:anthranilate phosphoribosyltransferase